jgi:hypothetical protein
VAKQYEVTYKPKNGTSKKTTKITSTSEQKAKETIEKMGGGNIVISVKLA